MARSIKLVQSIGGEEIDIQTLGALRFRVDASEPCGMPSAAVFVWKRLPASPSQTEDQDICSHVASPADMEEYPEDNPHPGGVYFRRTYIDFLFRSPAYCGMVWNQVRQAVEVLLFGLDTLDVLRPTATITLGECDSQSLTD